MGPALAGGSLHAVQTHQEGAARPPKVSQDGPNGQQERSGCVLVCVSACIRSSRKGSRKGFA
eukprot:6373171-Alexandrium_andersonii.AAC.1